MIFKCVSKPLTDAIYNKQNVLLLSLVFSLLLRRVERYVGIPDTLCMKIYVLSIQYAITKTLPILLMPVLLILIFYTRYSNVNYFFISTLNINFAG